MDDQSTATWLPLLLQTNDAFFPTGAYAHSLGFEEYTRMRGIRDEAGLREFVHEQVLPALAQQELPYLRFAHDAAPQLKALCEVDREISAWKIARELRDASIQVGGRRLAALRAMSDREAYRDFVASIMAKITPGHHLSVCALQASVEGFPLRAALAAYVYQTVAGVCSAALKLVRIGQDGCQRVLRGAMERAEETITASLLVEKDEAGWFDPLLEIASMRHEFADERLFIS